MDKVVSFLDYAAKKNKPKPSANNMSTTDVVEWVNEDLHKLAENLGVSKEEAYKVAEGFFKQYPALVSYVSEPSFRKDYPISLQ